MRLRIKSKPRSKKHQNSSRRAWKSTTYAIRGANKQRRLRPGGRLLPQADSPRRRLGNAPAVRAVTMTLAILALGFFLTRQVEIVEVGFKTKLDKEIKSEVNDYLDNHSRYVWLINKSRLADSLSEKFSSLKGTEISISPFSESITVKATNRIPAAVWQTEGIQYLIDADGVVMGKGEEGSNLPLIIDTLNVPVADGTQVTTSQFIAFLKDADSELKRTEISVKNYLIPNSPRELKANLASPEIEVIFDTARPAGNQVEDLAAILSQRGEGKLTINSYIDLRNPKKAYYK